MKNDLSKRASKWQFSNKYRSNFPYRQNRPNHYNRRNHFNRWNRRNRSNSVSGKLRRMNKSLGTLVQELYYWRQIGILYGEIDKLQADLVNSSVDNRQNITNEIEKKDTEITDLSQRIMQLRELAGSQPIPPPGMATTELQFVQSQIEEITRLIGKTSLRMADLREVRNLKGVIHIEYRNLNCASNPSMVHQRIDILRDKVKRIQSRIWWLEQNKKYFRLTNP